MNKVIHGDCLEVMPTLPDKSIDMILCDLPYGTTEIVWDSFTELDRLWRNYERIITDIGVILMFGHQPFTSRLGMSKINLLRHSLVWGKDKCGNFLMAKYQPMKRHEDILVFSKANFVHNATSRATYNPQMMRREKPLNVNTERVVKKTSAVIALKPNRVSDTFLRNKNYDNTVTYPTSYVYYPIEQKGRLHPTQKPVALFEYLIKTYTNEGETVLDNCAGSGTTAIACLNSNRNYILIEKEQEYIDIINKRIVEYEQQLTIT